MQYPSTGPNGRGQPSEASTFDPLIGRKVLTRWPEDNNFYEAVITDYNPREVGRVLNMCGSSLLGCIELTFSLLLLGIACSGL